MRNGIGKKDCRFIERSNPTQNAKLVLLINVHYADSKLRRAKYRGAPRSRKRQHKQKEKVLTSPRNHNINIIHMETNVGSDDDALMGGAASSGTNPPTRSPLLHLFFPQFLLPLNFNGSEK